jgi:hypothetical protein
MDRRFENGQALTELLLSLLLVIGFFFFAFASSEALEKSQSHHRFRTERRTR